MENITEIDKKKMRVQLMLPVIIFPFLTLMFWSLGGGVGRAEVNESAEGFNTELPSARAQKDSPDKLAMYEQAKRDSLKKMESAKNDPYYQGDLGEEINNEEAFAFNEYNQYAQKEKQVYDKLDELNEVLESSSRQEQSSEIKYSGINQSERQQQELRSDIERLEKMMTTMQSGSGNNDPEMEQINNVLESVLDIQHPERVQERLQKSSKENRGILYAVSTDSAINPVTLLDNRSVMDYAEEFNTHPNRKENDFFGIENKGQTSFEEHIAIPAVIHEDQTLVSGSTVKMRLLQGVYINGIHIPKDNFIYGVANLNGERLEVSIEDVRFGTHLLSVQLLVHDLDGLPGIKVPGAITRDVAKQGGERTLQGLNIGTMSPSIGAQAASAGIELGRNLLSRKIKLVKVGVKAGYQVLLKDNKRKVY